MKDLGKLKLFKSEIKTLIKLEHQIAIKYLTYMMFDNKQPSIDPP